VQLAISGECFYWYYKFQTQVTTRTAIIEKLGAKIQDMKCDAINKDSANALISGLAREPEDYAKIILFFGIFLGLTASFALASLFHLRKKYAAIS
jgi:hypothetical protein